jgi:hypothetical protein
MNMPHVIYPKNIKKLQYYMFHRIVGIINLLQKVDFRKRF